MQHCLLDLQLFSYTAELARVFVGLAMSLIHGSTCNSVSCLIYGVTWQYMQQCMLDWQVPFFIAAPSTTLDPGLQSGGQIVIEQRPAEEMTHFKGQRVVKEGVQVRC
jgi:methylthioribose-1-phosphate isomerase